MQNRLRAFGWKCDGEGTVGIGPGRYEHGHEPAAVGKIDVDVAEVGFKPLSGVVVERNKRRALGPPLGEEVLPDALVAAGVVVLVAQAPENLGDGVPLLAGSLFIAAQNRVDDRLEGIDDRRQRPALVLFGLGLTQDLANLPPRMMKFAGQLPNAQLFEAMRLSNTGVLVHLDHPPPPGAWFSAGRASG